MHVIHPSKFYKIQNTHFKLFSFLEQNNKNKNFRAALSQELQKHLM